jgi:hypothetical protein
LLSHLAKVFFVPVIFIYLVLFENTSLTTLLHTTTTMQLGNSIASCFIYALADDNYQTEDLERLLGIEMGTVQGQLMLSTWMTLYKRDGSVTTAAVSKALRTDTLPEAFHIGLGQSGGSGYIEELKARGLDNIPWMRMVFSSLRVNDYGMITFLYSAVASTLQLAAVLFGVAPELSLLANCTSNHSQRARVKTQREQAK